MNAGGAQVDITPTFEVDLAGFASRKQPMIGVLEPIFARAIYLETDDDKLLWIAADVIAFSRETVERFRRWAADELHLEARQVLLAATHTHYAPPTVHLTATGHFSARYVEWMEEQLRDAAQRAVATTEPCDFVAGSASLNLAIDRRNTPSSHVDPIAWALAFMKCGSDNIIAAQINYTMHPVTGGHIERRVTADWCGYASASLSQQLPGHPVALVTNGAAGNINPPAVDQPPQVTRGYGEAIATAVARGLLASPRQTQPRLITRSVEVAMPLDWHDEAGIDRVADEQISRIKPDWGWADAFREAVETWRGAMKTTIAAGGGRAQSIEIQTIQIGDVTIVAVNGEMFTRFTELLRESLGARVFTIAYANAAFGYIPREEAYAEGGYEVDTAHYFYNSFRPRKGSLELLAGRAIAMLK